MSQATIYVVDDDEALRDANVLYFRLQGLVAESFASAEDFLAARRDDWAGCVLLDLKMPGMGGLELRRIMAQRGETLPVVFVTAHGNADAVRWALKSGAFDFLEKPVDNDLLLHVVRSALGCDESRRQRLAQAAERPRRLEWLTSRERQVLESLVRGLHYREIAEELRISARNVEVYKARMMEKLRLRTLAELFRFHAAATGQDRGA